MQQHVRDVVELYVLNVGLAVCLKLELVHTTKLVFFFYTVGWKYC